MGRSVQTEGPKLLGLLLIKIQSSEISFLNLLLQKMLEVA
jgi:hypothetical protein